MFWFCQLTKMSMRPKCLAIFPWFFKNISSVKRLFFVLSNIKCRPAFFFFSFIYLLLFSVVCNCLMFYFYSHLPVQCLCEFLLSSGTLLQPEKQHKHQQLLQHLQMVLTDVNQDPQAPCEVLEYFLRRLSSSQATSRAQAIKVGFS